MRENETMICWLVELIGPPTKYLEMENGTNPRIYPFRFVEDVHRALKLEEQHAKAKAAKYQEMGLAVEAREHGFMAMGHREPARSA